jgi:mannose-6-phosphate isomerase-like protein (cupin superfamily)
MTGFVGNIEEQALNNSNFRQVIYTGQHGQLVLMSLKPKEEIGEEVHAYTDQFFRIDKGQGKVVIEGEETAISDGFAIYIPAGTKHNIINVSETEDLKLYTIYAPPHHVDGVTHATKEAAKADTGDHL